MNARLASPAGALEIDAALPATLGDASLACPTAGEIAAWCAQQLAFAPLEAPACVHARWKPGVSLSTCWSVRAAANETRLVVHKRYAGDKAALVAARPEEAGRSRRVDGTSLLWCVPEDRELPGLERILDRHRTTRLLHRLGAIAPWVARWATSTVELVRYKPEHRAVARLDLDLRFEYKGGAKSRRLLAARVLRPDRAATLIERRRALDAAAPGAPWPRLRGAEARTGIVFENWIDGRTFARDDFSSAELVGRLIATLHTTPCAAGRAPRTDRDAGERFEQTRREWSELFAADAALAAHARDIRPPSRAGTVWVHGDLHPDQVLIADEDRGPRLLDLDNLSPGDPQLDLGCFLADALAQRPTARWEEVAGPLLEGYRGHGPALGSDTRRLGGHVAWALAGQAAGALRRLEPGALARARSLLELAGEIAARTEARP